MSAGAVWVVHALPSQYRSCPGVCSSGYQPAGATGPLMWAIVKAERICGL